MHVLLILTFTCLLLSVDAAKKAKQCIGDNDPNIVDPADECPAEGENPEESSGKFEGDILVADKAEAANRNAARSPNQRWPKSSDGLVYVPYQMSGASSMAQRAIEAARGLYDKHTCIRFRERSNERDYISIGSGQGCFSALGRTGGGQQLSLGRGCEYTGVAAHELMHAIGFLHEQARSDRDDYVTVLWQNIQRGMESQFEKGDERRYTTQGLGYDYSSIMHYDKMGFSSNGRPTLEPKQAGAQIGQRKGLSKLDIEKINTLYDCDMGEGGSTTQKPVPKPEATQRPPAPRPTTPAPGPTGNCEDKMPSGHCERAMMSVWNFCGNPRYANYAKRCQKTCDTCPTESPPTPKPDPDCTDKSSSDVCIQAVFEIEEFCAGKFMEIAQTSCAKTCQLC